MGAPSDYVPPGWPAEVRPPGAADWERTAVAWLFDVCPPDYRAEEVLRRHPAVLARVAGYHVGAAIEGARRGLGALRSDLRGHVPPEVVEAAVEACQRQVAHLEAVARSVRLVEDALRGRRYRPRM